MGNGSLSTFTSEEIISFLRNSFISSDVKPIYIKPTLKEYGCSNSTKRGYSNKDITKRRKRNKNKKTHRK